MKEVNQTFVAESLAQTADVGHHIARQLSFPGCVYLEGEMGAGKTTLAKSIIAGFGYEGDVTSPTYNLIQEYLLKNGTIYHMDLYRVDDPGELEYLAIDELWGPRSLFLIEWAERGLGYLRAADYQISISKIFGNNSNKRQIILKYFS